MDFNLSLLRILFYFFIFKKKLLICLIFITISCEAFHHLLLFMTELFFDCSLFSFSLPCFIPEDFSRSPPPEPAPHDPALLVYKQQLHHQSNRAFKNPEDQSQDSCNLKKFVDNQIRAPFLFHLFKVDQFLKSIIINCGH